MKISPVEPLQSKPFIMGMAIAPGVMLFMAQRAALYGVVFTKVFSVVGKYQIIRVVVIPAAIKMVDVFLRLKDSAKFFLHYKPVLGNPVAFIGIGMATSVAPHITKRHGFTALPKWMKLWVCFCKLNPALSASWVFPFVVIGDYFSAIGASWFKVVRGFMHQRMLYGFGTAARNALL